MAEARKHVDFCPHCGNTAPQRIALKHRYAMTWYSEEDQRRDGGPGGLAIICICETCEGLIIYDGPDPAELDGEWPSVVFPQSAELGAEVPSEIRSIYVQAAKCKEHSPLAFAILIGRALEAICADRLKTDPTDKRVTLFNALQALAARGDIPPTLAKMTDVLRTLRNAAAHYSTDTITTPMTWAMDEFFRAIIAYVYTAPARLASFEERLAKMKKGRVERSK